MSKKIKIEEDSIIALLQEAYLDSVKLRKEADLLRQRIEREVENGLDDYTRIGKLLIDCLKINDESIAKKINITKAISNQLNTIKKDTYSSEHSVNEADMENLRKMIFSQKANNGDNKLDI